MSFVIADRRRGSGAFKPREPLKNTVNVAYPGKGALIFSVSKDVYDKIKQPRYAKLHIGTGEHAGMILLQPAAVKSGSTNTFSSVGGKKNRKGGRRQINFTPSRLGIKHPIEKFGVTKCDFKVVDEGLVISLPKKVTNGASQ